MLRRGIAILERWAPPARAGALLACLIYAALLFANAIPLEVDAHDYWAADPVNPYILSHRSIYGQDAYFYSPAFTQALSVLHALPWPVFAGLWALAMTGALLYVTGRWFGFALIVPVVAIEFAMGNVHIFFAAMIVAGFRYPALWALAFLTKITPGVGALWFAFRKEWSAFAIAISVTGAIAAVSFVLAPNLWSQWVDVLAATDRSSIAPATPFDLIPRPVRWAIGILLVFWGARSDRRWVVPVAVTLCLPMVYINGLAILVAAPALWARDRAARASTAAARPDKAGAVAGHDGDVVPAT